MVSFREKTFKNGLKIITAPDKDSPSFTLLFSVLAGSRFEKEGEEGLAHFLEHLAFKGSSKFPTQLDVAREVEGFGGEWNASTSAQRIQYYIKAAASNFGRAFDVLEDIVFRPLLIQEEIDKERGVILEEAKLYFDDPKSWVAIKNQSLLFKRHPLGKDVIGYPETIKKLSRDDFVRYRSKFFIPGRFVVGAAGNFKEGEFSSFIDAALAGLEKFPSEPLNAFKPSQKDPRFYFEKRPTKQINLMLSFLGKSAKDKDKYAAAVLSFILGVGLSSRLFQEVRTKRGLAYAISASHHGFKDTGCFAIYAGVLKEKVDEALLAVLQELDKVRKALVPEQEVERNKNHLKGLLALSLESNDGLIGSLVSQRMVAEEVLNYEEQCRRIDAVTSKDLQRLARDIFLSNRANLAVVGLAEDTRLKSLVETF